MKKNTPAIFSLFLLVLLSGECAADLVEQSKILALETMATGDSFAYSVDLSEDGGTIAVGYPGREVGGADRAGAVYVYTRSGTSWIQQAELIASDFGQDDNFGWSVSLSSTGDTLAIRTAIQKEGTATIVGAVYVFTRNGANWAEQQKLLVSDVSEFDMFGGSISLSSDGDTLAIGSFWRSSASPNISAAVYVFTRGETKWTQQAKLIPNNASEITFFGTSVSLSANGDVLAVGDDAGYGAVYVFARSRATWRQQQKISSNEYDWFGWTVSLSAAGNTLAIGAPQGSVENVAEAGSVFVFVQNGGTWTQQAKLNANDFEADSFFGHAVSLSSTGDALAIGAHEKEFNSAENTGAVYIFTRNGTAWTQQQKLVASDHAQFDRFGYSVSLSAAGHKVAIGAPGKRFEGFSTILGAAYVFEAPETTTGYQTSPETTTGYQTSPEQTTGYQTSPETTTGYQTSPETTTGYQTSPEQTTAYQTSPEQTTAYQTSTDQTGSDSVPLQDGINSEGNFVKAHFDSLFFCAVALLLLLN